MFTQRIQMNNNIDIVKRHLQLCSSDCKIPDFVWPHIFNTSSTIVQTDSFICIYAGQASKLYVNVKSDDGKYGMLYYVPKNTKRPIQYIRCGCDIFWHDPVAALFVRNDIGFDKCPYHTCLFEFMKMIE